MSAVSVDEPLTGMLDGFAVCVSTIKGSKVTAPLASKMLPAGEFKPHQLLVALSWLEAAPRLAKLLPAAAVLLVSRLKLITRLLVATPVSAANTPPPQLLTQVVPSEPVAVFPVMVALEIVVVSLVRLFQIPPP